MNRQFLSTSALALILVAAPIVGTTFSWAARAPTSTEARSFIAKAESDLENESLYVNRAQWVQTT